MKNELSEGARPSSNPTNVTFGCRLWRRRGELAQRKPCLATTLAVVCLSTRSSTRSSSRVAVPAFGGRIDPPRNNISAGFGPPIIITPLPHLVEGGALRYGRSERWRCKREPGESQQRPRFPSTTVVTAQPLDRGQGLGSSSHGATKSVWLLYAQSLPRPPCRS